MLFNVAAMSYRQRITPSAILGRVNAAFLWICLGVVPLGALTGGALGTALGLRGALWVCVLGTWAACLFVVCSPLRRMRDTPPNRPVLESPPGRREGGGMSGRRVTPSASWPG
ncbi:hypothetical protein NKG94_24430 [Micromonospora sp. M12]